MVRIVKRGRKGIGFLAIELHLAVFWQPACGLMVVVHIGETELIGEEGIEPAFMDAEGGEALAPRGTAEL